MSDNTNFQAPAFTARGTEREKIALPTELFDGTVNMPVMHHAVKAFLANQRQGNASTKIRKYVVGGNQKPWKQKGTGRARQGSTRAPHFVGGGTVFGPTPRAYDQYVPKQMRQLARKSAFNARARENAIVVIDRFEYDAPQTRRLQALVAQLGFDGRKVLILTDGVKQNVYLSGRNLPTVHVMPYVDVSTYHLLWSDVVLIEAGAIGETLSPVTETVAEPAPRAQRAAATPTKPAAKKAAAKKTPARKAAAKKSAPKAEATSAAKSAAKKKPAAKKAARKSATKSAAKSAAKKPAATKSAKKKGKE